jgi:cell division protein FtsW
VSRKLVTDVWLFAAAAALTVFGVIMVGSASSFVATGKTGDPSHFLGRQALFAVVGVVAMLLLMRLPYRWLARRGVVLGLIAGASTLLLVALLMPAQAGVHRWIPLGPFHLQPSELTKIVLIIFLAYMIERKGQGLNDWTTGLAPCLAVAGWLTVLVLIEPDFGTAVLLAAVAGTMLFVAGANFRHILLGGAAASVLLVAFLAAAPYRRERLATFLSLVRDGNPNEVEGAYQLSQSLLAFGAGGISGVSLGQGQQKAFFLPAPFTDFIYAVIGEELGLIGCVAVLVGFTVLAVRGLRAAERAGDTFGQHLAFGLTVLLVGQALVNIGVALGLLPTKGLPLPFISYGGSSLIASLMAVGILLSVSRRAT